MNINYKNQVRRQKFYFIKDAHRKIQIRIRIRTSCDKMESQES